MFAKKLGQLYKYIHLNLCTFSSNLLVSNVHEQQSIHNIIHDICFYLICLDSLVGVEILASNKLLVAGGQHGRLHWDDFGIKLDIPHDALPHGVLAEIVIHVSKSGPYVLPNSQEWKMSSAIYWITSSKDFQKPILLGIWHNINDIKNVSNIRFVSAEQVREGSKYIFRKLATGYFLSDDSYGYISLLHFSGFCIQASRDSDSKLVGSLLHKSSQSGYKFEYSFLIYEERPQGLSQEVSIQ